MWRRTKDDPLEPMATVARMLLNVAGVALVVTVVSSVLGQVRVCVVDPGIDMAAVPGRLAARAGVSVSLHGASFCVEHAGVGQRLLNGVAGLSGMALLAGVLFVVSRVIREAKRDGVFGDRLPRALRGLGWFIVVGGLVVMQLTATAQGLLLSTVEPPNLDAYQPPWLGVGLWDVPWATLLAGAGVLTFARIIRLGVAMRRDLAAR